MTESLTKRQREILAFMEAEIERRGIPPTVREVAARFGIASPNGVACHIKALEAKGYLRREPGISRGVSLPGGAGVGSAGRGEARGARYRLVGQVAAGSPILAVQSDDEDLSIDEAAGARPGDFLLKVKGDSMSGAGINPGDLAVVRPGAEARNGDIVVVLVGEEEATLKRFFMEPGGVVRLVPENPAYAEIIIDPRVTPVSVAGRLVGVVRKL
ncbi:MAG: transcriptional repressor LexA [Nitrospirae bacterium]|nr:transcriptional repressor LexA [Nitrospirota bacterium]MBI5695857.1 transcriptional repressor LexA [Nitrospirota bacterium]